MGSLRQLVTSVPEVLPASRIRKIAPVSMTVTLQQRIGNTGMRALHEQRRPIADLSPAVPSRSPSSLMPPEPFGPAPTAAPQPVAPAQLPATHPAVAEQPPAAEFAGPERPKQEAPADTAPVPEENKKAVLEQQVKQIARRQKKRGDSGAMVRHTARAAIKQDPEKQQLAAQASLQELEESAKKANALEIQSFRDALRAHLQRSMPDGTKNEDAARALNRQTAQNVGNAMKGELAARQHDALGNLPQTAEAKANPDALEVGKPPDLTPLPAGKQPQPPSAAGTVPDRLPDAALDTSADRADADTQLASQDLTQDQLKRSNEPSFVDAADTRDAAERHSTEGAAAVRAAEDQARNDAHMRGKSTLSAGINSLFESREMGLFRAYLEQDKSRIQQEEDRKKIAGQLAGIHEKTAAAVKSKLDEMEARALTIFNYGLYRAMWKFDAKLVDIEESIRKEEREEAEKHSSYFTPNWRAMMADWRDLTSEEVRYVIKLARDAYNEVVSEAIDEVANYVGPALVGIKNRINEGLAEAAKFAERLPPSLATIGAEELDRITVSFNDLSAEVDSRREGLLNKLGESYAASQKAIEARAQAFRDANKSWWQKLKEKIRGVIRAIIQIKDMFLTVLSRVAGVVGAILRDPGGFLGNFVSGVKRGLNNFIDHFPTHLKEGFFEWLFGVAAKAGITIPKSFDPPAIFGLIASIIGLTTANVRARAVAKVGEGPVAALERGAGILMTLKEKGLPGLWDMLAEKLEAVKASAIEQIERMLLVEVIKAGVTWIIGLLNPVAGFIKACKAIYEIVKFFINNWDRIVEFVNSVLDSIGAIARGQLDAAADYVEKTLARTIPIIIGFLAGLLSLGNIADKVKKVIERIQAPVNKAIDWLIDKAVGLVKAGAGMAAKAAKGVFNWIRAKVGFKDADGKSHSIYVEPGATPVLSIASDPIPAAQFLELYLERKSKTNKKFEQQNSVEIAAVKKAIKKSQGLVDEIAKLNRSQAKDPTGKELELLEKLLNANVSLSQALSDLLGRDESIAGKIKEKYLLEGVTGTYESIPKPKGDELTADHQPQAAILQACAAFDYFDTSGEMKERADKRAAQGFAINLHFNRHIAGRTFGSKGKATKEDFVKLVAPVKSKSKISQRKAAVDLIKAELKEDYNAMVKVAGDKTYYDDITQTKLPDKEKDELIEGISGRIKAGEREMLAQDLDALVK